MPGTYYAVVGGDRLTSRDGSRVFASGNGICNIEGEDGVRRRMVFIGDEAYCSACNSVCVIVGGAGVSEQRRMLDLVNGMRRQAVGGDEVLCKCSRPPRVIAVHGQRWMIHDQGDIPQQVARATESAPSLIYDEQFTLIDAAGNVLADTYYIVRMPSGELIHGINDSSGSSARYRGTARRTFTFISGIARSRNNALSMTTHTKKGEKYARRSLQGNNEHKPQFERHGFHISLMQPVEIIRWRNSIYGCMRKLSTKRNLSRHAGCRWDDFESLQR